MSRFSNGKSSSLLKDGSWIKKADDEEEDIDRDPNFGRSVLSQRSETTVGPDGGEVKTTVTTKRSTSVQALTKRFSGSQDELRSGSSALPSSPTTPTTKSVPAVQSPTTKFTDRVKSSSKGSLYTSYSPTRTTKEPETSVSSSNDAENKLYDTLIPSAIKNSSSPTDSKTSVFTSESVTVKSSPAAKDKPLTTLVPSSGKEVYSSTERNSTKTTTTTTISSKPEDDLYGTLLPRSITDVSDPPSSLSSSSSSSSSITTKREVITVESSRGDKSPSLSSPTSTRTTSYSSYTEDLPSTRTTSYTISTTPSDDYSSYSYSRPESSYEYSSITSPSSYTSTSYRSGSRSDDSDQIYSSSTKSVYAAPERAVLEKDLCTSCRRPFNGDAKMVLDDMKINCHASCFKCEVCSSTLGNMKAGDSMWIYKRMVHCENCFEIARGKWRR
uniref:LIM zinc-binding domain-containing protein n=1 Tax=Gasterosteus aculeatus aculeatus TaxID=481459 RepID=A0AAQ4R0Y7_GASAC|nr:sciellin isoform X2 [Gasterosteus aculeatus aculeatus]